MAEALLKLFVALSDLFSTNNLGWIPELLRSWVTEVFLILVIFIVAIYVFPIFKSGVLGIKHFIVSKIPSSISKPLRQAQKGVERIISAIFALILLLFSKLNTVRKTSIGSRILRFSAIGYCIILALQFGAKELIDDSDYVQCEPVIGGYSKLKQWYDPINFWHREVFRHEDRLDYALDWLWQGCSGFDSTRTYPDEDGFTPICYDKEKVSDKYRAVCPRIKDEWPRSYRNYSRVCTNFAKSELPGTTIFRCNSYAKKKVDEELKKY
jgi:hypothetical protein